MTIRKGDNCDVFWDSGHDSQCNELIEDLKGDFVFDKYVIINNVEYQLSLEFHKSLLIKATIFVDGKHFEQIFNLENWQSIENRVDKNGQFYIEMC